MHKNLFKSPTVTYLLAMGLQSTPLLVNPWLAKMPQQ